MLLDLDQVEANLNILFKIAHGIAIHLISNAIV